MYTVETSHPYLTGAQLHNGSFALFTDHDAIAERAEYLGARFGVQLTYRVLPNDGCAVAVHSCGVLAFDPECADDVVSLGPGAVEFVLRHEIHHLMHPDLAGRKGERAADAFAARSLVQDGLAPGDVTSIALGLFWNAVDDGVHDAGPLRIHRIAVAAWRHWGRITRPRLS